MAVFNSDRIVSALVTASGRNLFYDAQSERSSMPYSVQSRYRLTISDNGYDSLGFYDKHSLS